MWGGNTHSMFAVPHANQFTHADIQTQRSTYKGVPVKSSP